MARTQITGKSTNTGGGGAATQGGINFQNRVAAWVCVHMLAERPAPIIVLSGTPSYVKFVTQESVDDLLVGGGDLRHSFVQANRVITFSSAVDSEFASVVDQFVRQYLSSRGASGPRPRTHPLDAARDRLILATTSESSGPLRNELATVLNRARTLVAGQPLSDAAANRAQQQALKKAMTHVSRIWHTFTSQEPTEIELMEFIKLVSVAVLDVEVNQLAEREALNLLSSVLARRGQEAAAWSVIQSTVADLSQRHMGTDGAGIRAALESAGVILRSPPRYERDVEKLTAYTSATLRLSLAKILSDIETAKLILPFH